MPDATTLLPSSASPLERDLAQSLDVLPRIGSAPELIRNSKRENIPDSVVPWLLYEYGLGELLPYLSEPRTAISTGVLWQRLRGTPESFKIALGWIGNTGAIEESEEGTIRWSQFQLGLAQAPVDLSQTDSIVEIGRLSAPVRSSLFRIYGGWYDGRRFNLDDHQLSGIDPLCDHTGVYVKPEWPQLSFGREFFNTDGDISGYLAAGLGIHRFTWKTGLYEDRTILSNSVLGELEWRTLHMQDLPACISRLHFSLYGPWWNKATSWETHAWGEVFDWAGLQNKFTPALKFAKAGVYLSDYSELGDTNTCLPARYLEEFGDGPLLLSEADPATGEHVLSEHLSRVEYTEINERLERTQATAFTAFWSWGNYIAPVPITHGLDFSGWTPSAYNSMDSTYNAIGDGAGHQLGEGKFEELVPEGATSQLPGYSSVGVVGISVDSIVIDEVAGTITAQDVEYHTYSLSMAWWHYRLGGWRTTSLYDAQGRRKEIRLELYDELGSTVLGPTGSQSPESWGGLFSTNLLHGVAPRAVLHRERSQTIAYDDTFQLSSSGRSRLSEFSPLVNYQTISRDHTSESTLRELQSDQWQEAAQSWDSATWDGPDGWYEVEATAVDTWTNTYTWQNYPQLEQILGFSRTMLTLSESGHLSDTDGILGDTHATLGYIEEERFERSHQTTSAAHSPSGFFYLFRERFATLPYDDLFELSRSRLSEHIPLFNELSVTREHCSGLTWTTEQFNSWADSSPEWGSVSWDASTGWYDASNEPTWVEAYSWQTYPQLERVSTFCASHLILSDGDGDNLGDTHGVLGWDTSERFDRIYFTQAPIENRQSFTDRLHVRSYIGVTANWLTEPTWASGDWAGSGATDWHESTDDWQTLGWDQVDWINTSDITWDNQFMWGAIARWQAASMAVESQHETHT